MIETMTTEKEIADAFDKRKSPPESHSFITSESIPWMERPDTGDDPPIRSEIAFRSSRRERLQP
jgi:hypothetical protein